MIESNKKKDRPMYKVSSDHAGDDIKVTYYATIDANHA